MTDFNIWNEKKKYIHKRNNSPFCHERELWWCSLGKNIGYEQNGSNIEYRRPILVLKRFSRQTCLVIPLTTSTKIHALRPSVGFVDGKQACALLSQIKVVDTKRLTEKIGHLDIDIFEGIRKTAKDML